MDSGIVAFLVCISLVIPIEHLAFGRHMRWQRRELARRAIGDATVLVAGLLPVIFGDLDMMTWAVLAAGFILAGMLLSAMSWWERLRLREARRAVNEHAKRWEKEED